MFVGKVIGTVWSTVKWQETRGLKLLLVRPYHLGDLLARESAQGHPGGQDAASSQASPQATHAPGAAASARAIDSEAVVCVDLLDAGVGDDVIVAFGHAARVAAQEGSPEMTQGTAQGATKPGTPSGSGTGTGGSFRSAGRGEGQFSTAAANLPGRTAASTGVTTVPIDAAVVAIVDRIALARPGT
ncbi:MAG: EutN/CcmL family microcompartment protein [Polyangia bacterium]